MWTYGMHFSTYCSLFSLSFFFFLMIRRPPRFPLFPYTPLFRSVGFFDQGQAADARADVDSDAVGVVRADLNAGVFDRFDRRRQAVMDEGIHAARFLGRQIEIGRAHV